MFSSLKLDRFWSAWWKLLLAGLALMLLAVVPMVSCRESALPVTTYPVTSTIEEAGKTLGVILPVPTHLPPGCDVRGVKVDPTESAVQYYIYDDEKKYDVQLNMWYHRNVLIPYKMSPGYKTAFKASEDKNGFIWWGYLWEQPDRWHLIWPLPDAYGEGRVGGFGVVLYVSKNISEEEAIKIARSVRQPNEVVGGCSPWRGRL